ncbi:MAG: glycerophosphodiester phosphodiesterase [Pseudomonadota bacterium]
MARFESSHPYLADTRFAAFAHRGGELEEPENSKRAFAAAVAMGYRYIETDVQATADNVVLVFHDDELSRLTDGQGDVSALPFSEISQARIGGTEPIMTLEEALVAFPETRFNIDIKSDLALEPTLELVQKMNALNRVCLASFSDHRLGRIREQLGDAACTGAGPRDVAALKFASWGLGFLSSRCHCAQVPVSEYGITLPTRRFVYFCNVRGIAVHVWTIDEADEIRRLIRLGVNGIMSARPSLLKQIAQEEGVW